MVVDDSRIFFPVDNGDHPPWGGDDDAAAAVEENVVVDHWVDAAAVGAVDYYRAGRRIANPSSYDHRRYDKGGVVPVVVPRRD